MQDGCCRREQYDTPVWDVVPIKATEDLSFSLPLAFPASFNLLITCERSKQSTPQNKLSAVFLQIKNVLFLGDVSLGFFCRKAQWRWRHRDRHLRDDGVADGFTWSCQTFLFNKFGVITDSSSCFSVVRQRWSCPAKWIMTRVWVELCSNGLLLFVCPSRP